MNMIDKIDLYKKIFFTSGAIGVAIWTVITNNTGAFFAVPIAVITGLDLLVNLIAIATGRLKVVNEYPPAVQKQIAEAEAEMNKELEKESQERFKGLIIGYPFGFDD